MAFSDWNEKKKLLVSAGVVAGLAVILGGVIAFLIKERKDIEAQTASQEAEGKKYQNIINKKPEFQKRLDDLSNQSERTKSNAPDKPQVAELLDALSKEASAAGLKLLSAKVAPEARKVTRSKKKGKASKFKDVTIDIECIGSFNAFGKFINSIESLNFSRYVETSDFSIVAHREGLVPDADLTEFSVKLVAKYYPPKAVKKKK